MKAVMLVTLVFVTRPGMKMKVSTLVTPVTLVDFMRK